MLSLLSLAVEYQVKAVQERCESFPTSKLHQAQNGEIERINTPTLLSYVEWVEKYNLPNILRQAVQLFTI